TGIINEAGDHDIYYFLALGDGQQTVRLDTVPGLTGMLEVFDGNRDPVNTTPIAGGVTFDVTQGEYYYVSVTGVANGTGAYVLPFGPALNSPLNGALTTSGPATFADPLGVPQSLADRVNADAARDGYTPVLIPLSIDKAGQ